MVIFHSYVNVYQRVMITYGDLCSVDFSIANVKLPEANGLLTMIHLFIWAGLKLEISLIPKSSMVK